MSRIRTYVRLRPPLPTTPPSLWYRPVNDKLHIDIAEDENLTKFGRKGKVQHGFQFTRVFDTTTSQDEVFCTAAKDVVESFLNGYNATVFAYGQTSSGKTYTIEGSYKKFSDRGIIPRALAMIYQSLENRTDEDVKVQISYLEIYQETGYDLLNPGLQHSGLVTRLPKVTIFQADQNNIVFRNLSVHLAANEEIARSLLFQGRTNRKVAETPMNKRSSRSHAIFSIYLTTKPRDSPVTVMSKLHLVDLAGSERVAKTKVRGLVLQEAKYINLSLHHLEHVIVALQKTSQNCRTPRQDGRQEKSGYVPYRNSMLTTVLRDSIGGNCMTVMIATLSVEETNVWESISTCRFAQRVACIANPLRRNEVLNDKEVIKRLNERIKELEDEVFSLKQKETRLEDDPSDSISSEDKQLCKKLMTSFVAGSLNDPVASGINSSAKFKECLRLLKRLITNLLEKARGIPQHLLEQQASQASTPDTGFEEAIPCLLPQSRTNTESSSRSSSKTSGFNSEEVSHESSPSLMTTSIPIGDVVCATSPKQVAWESRDTSLDLSSDKSRALETTVSASDKSSCRFHDQKRSLYMSSLEERNQAAISNKSRKLDIIKQRQHKETVRLTLQHLQLLEEDYREKLDESREQIAIQHARIVALKRQGAGDSVIAQERLAEQQLQLKEGRLRHQLQEIRQQLTQISPNDNPLSVSSNQVRIGVDSKTVLHKLRQEAVVERDKIEQHLNEVKLFQMEQQLALKEEATRRKLLAFKQQLHCQFQQNQSQKPEVRDSNRVDFRRAENQSREETRNGGSWAAAVHIVDKPSLLANADATETVKRIDGQQAPSYNIKQATVENNTMIARTQFESKRTHQSLLELSSCGQASVEFDIKTPSKRDVHKASNRDGKTDELSLRRRVNASKDCTKLASRTSTFGHLFDLDLTVVKGNHVVIESSANNVITDPDPKKRENQTVTQSRVDDPNDIKFESSRCVRKDTRAIPENDSEKQYVSAAARHKDRVEKIRKAMKAATIIQRSWKRYKRLK